MVLEGRFSENGLSVGDKVEVISYTHGLVGIELCRMLGNVFRLRESEIYRGELVIGDSGWFGHGFTYRLVSGKDSGEGKKLKGIASWLNERNL